MLRQSPVAAATAATASTPSSAPKPPPLSSSPSPKKAAEAARRRLSKEKLKKQEKEKGSSRRPLTSSAAKTKSTTTSSSQLQASTSQTLRSLSAHPKRSLGQNFVVDEGVLSRVVESALSGFSLSRRRRVGVLEIGPGTGNLTRRLLGYKKSGNKNDDDGDDDDKNDAVVAALTAVEKDDALSANLLSELAPREPRLRVVHEDFLRVNLPEEIRALRERAAAEASRGDDDGDGDNDGGGFDGDKHPRPLPRAVVVANLPYNITSDALRLLLPMGDDVSDVFLMLQKEAAERLGGSAREGDGDWRGASVLARYFSEPRVLFDVEAGCFLPRPRVDSALVRFKLKRPEERNPRASDERLLRAVVRAAFSQRRKALRNSLGALFGGAEAAAAIERAGLDPSSARADAVSVAQFVEITNAIIEASFPSVGYGDEDEDGDDGDDV